MKADLYIEKNKIFLNKKNKRIKKKFFSQDNILKVKNNYNYIDEDNQKNTSLTKSSS